MKIVRFANLDFIPASHEDPKNPSNLKKVLLKRDNLPEGRIQMINWAKLPKGKAFAPHYHEKMIEVFILISGKVRTRVDSEEEILEKGDMVIVMEKQVHSFENISEQEIDYLCLGIATSENGKTIVV